MLIDLIKLSCQKCIYFKRDMGFIGNDKCGFSSNKGKSIYDIEECNLREEIKEIKEPILRWTITNNQKKIKKTKCKSILGFIITDGKWQSN